MKYRRVVVVAVSAALALSACSSDKKPSSDPNANDSGSGDALTVYTTEGLKDIATRLAKAYTANHKSANITVNANSTPESVKASVAKGTPQVLLFVDPGFGRIDPKLEPVSLGQNRAVIAVSTANPKKVADVSAFAAATKLHVSMCGARTGFGNITLWVMFKAKIKPKTAAVGVGCEAGSMSKLVTKKLDAVLLFRGLAYPPKGVKLVGVPAKQNIIFKFSYQVVGKSAAARGFGAFLASAGAKQVLAANGYLP